MRSASDVEGLKVGAGGAGLEGVATGGVDLAFASGGVGFGVATGGVDLKGIETGDEALLLSPKEGLLYCLCWKGMRKCLWRRRHCIAVATAREELRFSSGKV